MNSDKPRIGRRDVLRALGGGAGLAAASGAFTTEARADSENNEEKRKSRYRETEHVKTFYRVNRYPTKR
ncbi:MAG TPA: formate dehydrogenase [Hyphomicrobiaceae bacterium]|jgi:hypothetical protein|nr:formate dehydrogenase [Hyphomicrobiaceae bacterium]